MNYTREKLIEICDRAIVQVDKWGDRDTPNAHLKVGECWSLLKAGCKFKILEDKSSGCCTDADTIWMEITYPTFYTFECDRNDLEISTFYLPTEARLERANNGDWY